MDGHLVGRVGVLWQVESVGVLWWVESVDNTIWGGVGNVVVGDSHVTRWLMGRTMALC